MTINVQLSKFFGSFQLRAEFEAPARGITGLLGPSGSGKTSLLRCMAGLERADGRMSVGVEMWQDRELFTHAHQRPIGYVFQDSSLFTHLNVAGNLKFGMKRVPAKKRTFEYDRAVDLFGLSDLLNRVPATLSGGERQRVAMARALLTSPKLMLLDEPLSSLDIASKESLFPFLERVHEELDTPVFYVSHDPDEIARLADHIILMNRGEAVASGSIQEVFTSLDFPIASSTNAVSVITAEILSHDDKYHLSTLTFSGGTLEVPRIEAEVGRSVRVRIHARDVSLTREKNQVSSILNTFPAKVVEMSSAVDMSQITVKLRIGNESVLSRITNKSADALGVASDVELYAQVKSVSLLT